MRPELAVFLAAFAFFGWAASPAHFWLDSGEIAAAGADLGVMHPPGASGYPVWLYLAQLLPIGPLGWRMSLFSAAFAATSLAFWVGLMRRRGLPMLYLAAGVLWIAVGWTFVRNARVVEIYSYGAALFMLALWGFDPLSSAKDRNFHRLIGCMAATVAGWGFGDLRLLFAPALLWLWVRAWKRGEAWTRWAPLVIASSSAVALVPALASGRAPAMDWGNPDQLGSWWDYIRARSITDAFSDQILPRSFDRWLSNAELVGTRLIEDLGPFGLMGVALALWWWWREKEDRGLLGWVVWCFVIQIFYATGINPMGGKDRQTGILFGLLSATAVVSVLHRAKWGADWGNGEWPSRLRLAVYPLIAVALILPPWLSAAEDHQNTRSWMPHAWTRAALADLPPDALLLTQSDDLSAGIDAARLLEGARPDLLSIPAQHLYRSPSEATLGDPRAASLWEAAKGKSTDRERIEAALSIWPDAVALESPATGVLSGLAVSRGVPSEMGWLEDSQEHPAIAHLHRGESLARGWGGGSKGESFAQQQWARWREEARGPEDRRRLARTLDLHVRGRLRLEEESRARLEWARGVYRFLLEHIEPEHTPAWVAWALVEARLGEEETALEAVEHALSLQPDRYDALSLAGALYSKYPQTSARARRVLERATALYPLRTKAWIQLADLCRRSGERDCERRANTALEPLRDRGVSKKGSQDPKEPN